MNDIQRYLDACGYQPDDVINVATQQPGHDFQFSLIVASDAAKQISYRPRIANVWISANPVGPITRGRGRIEDVTAVRALYADLDVKQGGLATMGAAQAVIDTLSEFLGTQPVAVVLSGHGMQPRWLLEESLGTGTEAKAMLDGFGRLVQQVAQRHGGEADWVFDATRILRAPGSVNNKDPEHPISVQVQFYPGGAVSLDRLREVIEAYAPEPELPTIALAPRAEHIQRSRGDAYAKRIVDDELAALRASAGMRVGTKDERGRSWEKIQADLAFKLAGVAKADWNSFGEDELHAMFLDAAPVDSGWSKQDAARKWVQQWARAEPKEPPVEKKVQSDDPLADNYVDPAAGSGGGPELPSGGSAGDAWPVFAQTDKGYAARLARRYGETVRYSPRLESWLRYADGRWIEDKLGGQWAAHELTGVLYELEGGQYDDTNEYQIGNRVTTDRREFRRWLVGQEATSRMKAAADALKASGVLNVELSEFDQNTKILNAADCAVDIQEAQMMPHSPSLMMRRKTPVEYDPNAKAPEWEAFLQQAQPVRALREFIARVVGYSLTGMTSEQVIFLHRGPTRSGKSVFLRVLSAVLGEYARPMPESLLLNKNTEAHPTGIAGLEGCRVVYTDETPQGARWDEAVLKRLTGETPITARGMHQDFRDFRLTAKVHIVTNFLPHISSDEATHRRLVVVPWDRTVPLGEVDTSLAERIVANELPGVLAWAVRGAQEWTQRGLDVPEDAKIAKAKYIQEEDEFGEWLSENTVDTGANGFITPTKVLYQDYRSWMQGRGAHPMQMTTFGKELERRKKLQGRTARYRGWRVALQTVLDDAQDPLEARR